MLATIQQYLTTFNDWNQNPAAGALFRAIGDRLASQTLTTPGLAIKAGGGVLVKAVTAFYATANAILVKTAANTDMPALSGTVTNAKFNVFIFYVDSAGTFSVAIGGEGATLAQVTWPNTPQQKAMVGFIIVNPTGTGNFVGNTTALDDGTVVPNVVYVNTLGAFDPTVRLGV